MRGIFRCHSRGDLPYLFRGRQVARPVRRALGMRQKTDSSGRLGETCLRATSVEADHRLDRFRPSPELNSKPNNKIVKLKAIRVGTIIRRTGYSCVNCIATAQWWEFMIPPSRQRFKSFRPLLPEEFSQHGSYRKRISGLQWNQTRDVRFRVSSVGQTKCCLRQKDCCAATNLWILQR
jgi:hypothetical protein